MILRDIRERATRLDFIAGIGGNIRQELIRQAVDVRIIKAEFDFYFGRLICRGFYQKRGWINKAIYNLLK